MFEWDLKINQYLWSINLLFIWIYTLTEILEVLLESVFLMSLFFLVNSKASKVIDFTKVCLDS